MTPSGTDLRPLTPLTLQSASPAFSPNGKQIVYARYTCDQPASGCRTWRSDLWTMAADGSHQHQLTQTPRISEALPDWSPDGRHIAYSAVSDLRAGGGANYGIWLMNADGSHRHRLTRMGYGAAWSPNGQKIAFYTERSVFVVPATGGHSKKLTNGYRPAPDWSPDGRRIVFSRNDDLWMMNADGSHQHQLTSGSKYNEMNPAWSPDGRWIAYTRAGSSFQLYLIRPDGTGRHAITHTPDNLDTINDFPAWQPR